MKVTVFCKNCKWKREEPIDDDVPELNAGMVRIQIDTPDRTIILEFTAPSALLEANALRELAVGCLEWDGSTEVAEEIIERNPEDEARPNG